MKSNVKQSELFGGEELPAVGQEITAVLLDSDVVIYAGTFPNNTREHEFRIGADILLSFESDSETLLIQYEPFAKNGFVSEHITELSKIVGQTVVHARPFKSGVLELVLESEAVVRVMPLDRFESWTYTFRDMLLVCPPGGFVA